jgi:hypothetical protein
MATAAAKVFIKGLAVGICCGRELSDHGGCDCNHAYYKFPHRNLLLLLSEVNLKSSFREVRISWVSEMGEVVVKFNKFVDTI